MNCSNTMFGVACGVSLCICLLSFGYVAAYWRTKHAFRRNMLNLFDQDFSKILDRKRKTSASIGDGGVECEGDGKQCSSSTKKRGKDEGGAAVGGGTRQGGDKKMKSCWRVFFFLPSEVAGIWSSFLPVTRLEVKKQYKSKTKPLLLSFSFFGYFEKKFVYKREDVLNDLVAQKAFAYMNRKWRRKGREWFIPTYKVVRIDERSGLVEFVESSNSAKLTESDMRNEKFIPSLIGGIVGMYAMGVRDQHFDNILIRRDGAVLHIDFGYILQPKSLMLGTRVAIPKICFRDPERKRRIIEGSWNAYVDVFLVEKGDSRAFKDFIVQAIRTSQIEETPFNMESGDAGIGVCPPDRHCERDGEGKAARRTSSAARSHVVEDKISSNRCAVQSKRFSSMFRIVGRMRRKSAASSAKLQEKAKIDAMELQALKYFVETGCIDHVLKEDFTKHVRVFSKMVAKNFVHRLVHGTGDD